MCDYCKKQEPRPELLALAKPGEPIPSSLWLANHTSQIDENDIDWARKMLVELERTTKNAGLS